MNEEIAQIARMPIVALRARYRVLFGGAPPRAFGPDLLRRSIAFKLQAQVQGDLPRWARTELDQLTKASARNSTARITLPRRIKPGSVLVREWKSKVHRVTVLDDGFFWDDRRYESLSEIARVITGTRWNGPRFFGLRTKSPGAGSTPSR